MNSEEANESLYAAADEGNLFKLNEAIGAGADKDYQSREKLSIPSKNGRYLTLWGIKNTSLHVACLRGFVPLVRRLLDINANVNATNEV